MMMSTLCRYYAHNHEYLEISRSYQAIYEALVKSEAQSSDTAMAVEGQPEWVPVSIFETCSSFRSSRILRLYR